MKRILVLIAILTFLTSCNTEPTTTIVTPLGKKTEELLKEKDTQISELKKQNEAVVSVRAKEQKQSSLAAANIEGVLYAAQHVELGLPRTAIEEESKLGKSRLPEPDPQEVNLAKDRVIAILENKITEANEKYKIAYGEAVAAKKEIQEKDKTITAKDIEIKNRDDNIIRLEKAATVEREQHTADIKKFVAAKDKEIADIKADYASKERKWWINATRIAGLGLIVAGVLAMIIIKAVPEGAGLALSGLLIGLFSIFIDWLTAQWWFYWAFGSVLLLALVAGGFAVYRMWKKNTLHGKLSAAFQDAKDESITLGQNTWEKLSEHLKYRLGDKTSFWGKEQVKELVNLGLIDKSEAAPTTPKEPAP